MRKYLVAAVSVAALSLILTLLAMGSLYGFNPFGLDLVSRFGEAQSLTDLSAYVQAVSAIATAIATIFALIVGAIAIIAVIQSERSEHQSLEQIKVDFASLGSLALSLRNRVMLYTNIAAVDPNRDIFQHEREKLQTVLTNPTGLALYLWSVREEGDRMKGIFNSLCGLVDCLTLAMTPANAQQLINLIGQRASDLIAELAEVTEAHFVALSQPLNRLGEGLAHAAMAVQRDPFTALQQGLKDQQLAAYRAPTEAEVAYLMKLADAKIGGQAAQTVGTFGRQAIEGTAKERATFHNLVHALFKIQLDDLMASASSEQPPPPSARH